MSQHIFSRRQAFRAALIGSGALALGLAGCATTSSNGTTTVSIDVAKIDTDGDGVIAAFEAALTAPLLAALIPPATLTIVGQALTGIKTALGNIDALSTNGVISVSANVSSAQGFVQSIINDAGTIVSVIKAAIPQLTVSDVVAEIQDYLAAASSLLPLIQVAVGMIATPMAYGSMSETQALAVAHGVTYRQALVRFPGAAR